MTLPLKLSPLKANDHLLFVRESHNNSQPSIISPHSLLSIFVLPLLSNTMPSLKKFKNSLGDPIDLTNSPSSPPSPSSSSLASSSSSASYVNPNASPAPLRERHFRSAAPSNLSFRFESDTQIQREFDEYQEGWKGGRGEYLF